MTTPAQLPVIVGAAAFGLVFGSFVTALSYRLPRGVSIADGRSRCAHCGHDLAARDLVPVLSWMVHGGKCGYCGGRISPRYPVIELISMLLFVGAVIAVRDPVRMALLLCLTPPLLALAVIDLEQRQLPNVLIAVLVPLLMLWRWRTGGDLIPGIGAALAIFLAATVLNAVMSRVAAGRAPLLGGGDGKLLAVSALALSAPSYFLFMIAAGFFGLVLSAAWRWKTGQSRFPFGPALVSALWLVLAARRFLPF